MSICITLYVTILIRFSFRWNPFIVRLRRTGSCASYNLFKYTDLLLENRTPRCSNQPINSLEMEFVSAMGVSNTSFSNTKLGMNQLQKIHRVEGAVNHLKNPFQRNSRAYSQDLKSFGRGILLPRSFIAVLARKERLGRCLFLLRCYPRLCLPGTLSSSSSIQSEAVWDGSSRLRYERPMDTYPVTRPLELEFTTVSAWRSHARYSQCNAGMGGNQWSWNDGGNKGDDAELFLFSLILHFIHHPFDTLQNQFYQDMVSS